MGAGSGFPRQSADWLGMTPLARCAGRCTPRVLVPLRSTAWASPPTDEQRGVRSCDVSPSVTAKAVTPQLRFAAQPSVSTGPPRRGRRGEFRAPARVTFGRSPKSDQKGCLKPKVSRLPARYALAVIRGCVPHGHGNLTLSCGQKDSLCVCAAAAGCGHGRGWCVYISEKKRQRSKKQRQCNI